MNQIVSDYLGHSVILDNSKVTEYENGEFITKIIERDTQQLLYVERWNL